MSAIVVVVGLLITALGLLGLASPRRLIHFVKSVQTPAGLYSAAGLRVLLGVALWFAAPDSRAPDALRILGVVVLVAGLVTPFFGLERFRKLLDMVVVPRRRLHSRLGLLRFRIRAAAHLFGNALKVARGECETMERDWSTAPRSPSILVAIGGLCVHLSFIRARRLRPRRWQIPGGSGYLPLLGRVL